MHIKTCFFFGGYDLSPAQIKALPPVVAKAVDDRVAAGVTRFLSAGLPVFDIMCAERVLHLKQNGLGLSLEFILPCRDMSPFYPEACMRNFKQLLALANTVSAVGKHFQKGSLLEAVRRMDAQSTHVLHMDSMTNANQGKTVL